MRLGERIRILRKVRGLQVQELARSVGMNDPSQLSAIESGRNKNPRISMVRAIANALGVTSAELTGESYMDELDGREIVIGSLRQSATVLAETYPALAKRSLTTASLLEKDEDSWVRWALIAPDISLPATESEGNLTDDGHGAL